MSLEIVEELIARQRPEAQAIIRLLLARIAELEARLNKSPQNSSLPPSSQHPHAKPAPKKRKSKRKRGGQPGHPKRERPLLPTEQCDDVRPLKPSECRRCGTKLSGTDADPLRHQVWELPELRPIVIEYQRHRLSCRCCGEVTCGELPAGVPRGQAGPRLVAFTALLMGSFRLSKRKTASFLSSILNVPCSPGWVVKLQRQATAALRPGYDDLVSRLPEQGRLNIDESPSKQGPTKTWLWTFVAAQFTVFSLRLSRKAEELYAHVGKQFTGAVGCDRAKMYVRLEQIQWCWAHLRRDFQALIDSHDQQVKRLGRELMREADAMFALWHRVRDGTLSRRTFKTRMSPIRRRVEALLLRGVFSGNPRLMGMCEELYDGRENLWTFLDVEGIGPTNNDAERALRHAVIWRKLSFGTQSAAGSRFVETMLTVIETCRQQHTNAFAYVIQAVEAHFAAQTAPKLIAEA
jgi:transposase